MRGGRTGGSTTTSPRESARDGCCGRIVAPEARRRGLAVAIGFPRGSRREPDPDDRRLRARPADGRPVARRRPPRPPRGARRAPPRRRHGRAGAAPARRRGARGARGRRGPPAGQGARRGPVLRCRAGAARRLPARRALRRPRRHRRRPLPLAAHPRRGRPAPDRRGPPRAAVGRARRPRAHATTPRRAPSPARASRCGRPRRRACASPATSTAGAAGRTPCARWAAPACGSCSCPGIGAGTRYKFRILGARRPLAGEGRPAGVPHRDPARHGVRRGRVTHEWGDDEWMHRRAPAAGARRADEHLRGAPRLVAARAGLPRDGPPARRLPRRDRLHPRRAAARGRAPVRRVVGLPGHVVLRPDRALRHPRRLPLVRRPPAPARLRRHRRLGARALPARRVGAREVRRHPALRARRPAPRRAARLGHARVRLRPQGGAQLPRRQRAVLARPVPHRRPARRRRRLDALPRLLPPRGAVAAQHPRRPGEPRRGRVPAGDERHRLPDLPRRGDDRRGVDGLAGRLPAHPPRRPGLRLQVEHGVDARHARLHRARPDLPRLPPQPDDLLADVRVQRELRAPAQPRRGRARQGLAVAADARRRVEQGGQPARAAGVHVGAPGQAAAVPGRRVRAGAGVVRAALAGLAPARRPAARRHQEPRRRHEPGLPGAARAVDARRHARGLLLDRRQRLQRQRAELPAPRRRRRRQAHRDGVHRELLRHPQARLPGRPAVRRAVARGAQHRRHQTTAARAVGNSARSTPSSTSGTGGPRRPSCSSRPSGVLWLAPEPFEGAVRRPAPRAPRLRPRRPGPAPSPSCPPPSPTTPSPWLRRAGRPRRHRPRRPRHRTRRRPRRRACRSPRPPAPPTPR